MINILANDMNLCVSFCPWPQGQITLRELGQSQWKSLPPELFEYDLSELIVSMHRQCMEDGYCVAEVSNFWKLFVQNVHHFQY